MVTIEEMLANQTLYRVVTVQSDLRMTPVGQVVDPVCHFTVG